MKREISRRERDEFSPDATIHQLAARQHGVVARGQLLEAGIPIHAIDNRVRNGRLVPLHRAVYRVPGPVPGRHEREIAAVLACGPSALLSHGSAAGLHRLPLPGSPDGRTEVVVVQAFRRPGGTVRVRRLTRLDPADRAVVEAVPVTSPPRTLLDLAARVRARTLEQAVAWADREGLATRSALEAVVARYPETRGAAPLRALLASGRAPAFVRSEAEERFLALVRRAGLPRPRVNVILERMEVDFFWPAERLVVEVDGRAHHAHDDAFERDRRRDAALTAAGYRVMRATWRQVSRHPETVLVTLARALAGAPVARRPA